MAAGLTVREDKIEALADWLDERLAGDVARASGNKALLIDAIITPRGLNPVFVDAMEAAGPYGMGWPGPRVVTGPVRVVKCDIVGKDHVRAIVAGDDGAVVQGDGVPAGRERTWPTIAPRRAGPQILAGGPRKDRRLGRNAQGRAAYRRRRFRRLMLTLDLPHPNP